MKIQRIDTNWKMKELGSNVEYPANVPGSVYKDLIENRVMEDPFYRDNETEALQLMKKDYEYWTSFSCTEELWEQDAHILRFEGIDTIADVFLNGIQLGHVENMHRTWEYDVTEQLKKKDNLLCIRFYSPLEYIRQEDQQEHWQGVVESMKGTPHIRKAQYMFGWDWGPRLPDAGIFRPVKLLGIQKARIDSVYIWQEHSVEGVELKLDIDVECLHEEQHKRFGEHDAYLQNRQLSYSVTICDPQNTIVYEGATSKVFIENPLIWWPNGMGEHPLYTVQVTLYDGGEECDRWEKRIGLRTATMERKQDIYGESFTHVINDIPIFAMGADYIPEDSILSRRTEKRTRELLEQAVAANFNCIRVWGGGYYPDDFFWDICDELGLLVWMDFAFACAVYRLPEAFELNICAEFKDNIKRIRNHASLALWCGNNEIEGFFYGNRERYEGIDRADYVKIFEYILPKIVKQYDPQTFYWPSSPSAGGAFSNTENENFGDTHYWDVWHGNKPFTEYRKFFFRYLSEFGFQSFPSIRTVESFTLPEDRNIFSYVMEKHQRNAAANGKIMNYMEQTYLYPSSLDTLIYASQLLQADAIRYGVEHFRRHRGRCMGTVIWQLNDCWPVASWSSIDYYGRWKALHYAAKRFFAPLLLSCQEESILTQGANPNAEPYTCKKSIRLCVTNDTRKEQQTVVQWELRDHCGTILRQSSKEVLVAPLSCIWLEEIALQELQERTQYVSYELKQQEQIVGSGTVLFTLPKFFEFCDPQLEATVEGDEIVVKAKAYARCVEIRNAEDNLRLSDNYFDINAGGRRVKIISGVPEKLEVRSVYHIR